MFDHVVMSVRDYAVSKAFFVQALQPLGVAVVSDSCFALMQPFDVASPA